MSAVDGVIVAIPPPKGIAVDFSNPQRNGTTAMYLVFAIGILVSHLFLAQNLYVKLYLRRKMDIEVCKFSTKTSNLQEYMLTGLPGMVLLAEATSLTIQGLLLCEYLSCTLDTFIVRTVCSSICLLDTFIYGIIGVHAWEISMEKFGEFAKVILLSVLISLLDFRC